MDWSNFITQLTPMVANAFRDNYPNGFGNQRTQTVTAFEYPGMKQVPRPAGLQQPIEGGEKFRFGARVVQRPSGGFLVLDVFNGSPAQKAGLETGDIIVEIDGKPVNSEEEFANTIDKADGEMSVTLIDIRTQGTITQKVRLR